MTRPRSVNPVATLLTLAFLFVCMHLHGVHVQDTGPRLDTLQRMLGGFNSGTLSS
jgi:hypothetical protein